MDFVGNFGVSSAVLSGLFFILAGYNFSKAEKVANSLHYKTIAFRCLLIALVCIVVAGVIAYSVI